MLSFVPSSQSLLISSEDRCLDPGHLSSWILSKANLRLRFPGFLLKLEIHLKKNNRIDEANILWKRKNQWLWVPLKNTRHTQRHTAHTADTRQLKYTRWSTHGGKLSLGILVGSSYHKQFNPVKIVILFESFSLTYICFLSFKRITHFSMMMNKFKIALINLQCRWEKWWSICICYEQETKNCRTASWLGNHVVSIKNISFGS